MQTSRLFRLLYILLEHGRVPAAELARELEVSVRTVYRDVQSLCEAGVPLYAERGRNGGVAILPSFKLSRSMVSGAEKRDILASLQAMTTVGASEKATLGQAACRIRRRIRELGAHRLFRLERRRRRDDCHAEKCHPLPQAAWL